VTTPQRPDRTEFTADELRDLAGIAMLLRDLAARIEDASPTWDLDRDRALEFMRATLDSHKAPIGQFDAAQTRLKGAAALLLFGVGTSVIVKKRGRI
jgi:hypothetical protein